jgi:hypothetical protein
MRKDESAGKGTQVTCAGCNLSIASFAKQAAVNGHQIHASNECRAKAIAKITGKRDPSSSPPPPPLKLRGGRKLVVS